MSPPERCPWTGIGDPIYAQYHDDEWGVPLTSDTALFEKLSLEAFQSGLSWLTILKKRENFRTAFSGFDPKSIARYGERDLARLMADAGIVRNRLKIDATINNARALIDLQKRVSLTDFIWRFVEQAPAAPVRDTFAAIPAQTDTSKAIAKALKAEGFRFVGPTTAYAFMQSSGMVNDHITTCHRHKPCAALQMSYRKKRQRATRDG